MVDFSYYNCVRVRSRIECGRKCEVNVVDGCGVVSSMVVDSVEDDQREYMVCRKSLVSIRLRASVVKYGFEEGAMVYFVDWGSEN